MLLQILILSFHSLSLFDLKQTLVPDLDMQFIKARKCNSRSAWQS